MKKLLFRKLFLDLTLFFLTVLLIIGLIVWTLQAINYFDFVSKDGHGLKIYFLYSFLNFPKIINRILPFVYFIALFSILVIYEIKNQLNIFWLNGISKLEFANKLIIFSLILMFFQILLGSFISPSSQFKSRSIIKDSNIDYLSNLIKEGKFVNLAKNFTMFVDNKKNNDTYFNIFIEDNNNQNSRMIYAKEGFFINKKILKLLDGKIIDRKNNDVNIFSFQQININLQDYKTKTTTSPKIQEVHIFELIECFDETNKKGVNFDCNQSIFGEIKQELFKRIFKPIYIPIIASICCFLLIMSKQNLAYYSLRKKIFIIIFIILVFSEASLRYSTINNNLMFIYFFSPICIFIFSYLKFKKKIKNV